MLLLCSQIIDFITSVSQVRAGDDGGSGERQRLYGRCLLQPGVEPTGHKDRPFPSHRRCLNSPITWLPVGPRRNVRGALGAVSAMSQPCSPVSLCWKGKVSCLPAMGAAGLERSLMQERRGLCHPPLTRFPSPGQSPVYQASAPHIPNATAPGADPGPGMGQDTCVPPRVSAVDVTSPVTVPLLPEPPNPHLHPPTAQQPPGPSPPSWSISSSSAGKGEHTAMRRVFYSCARSSSPGQDSEPPQDKSVGSGHSGVSPRKQLLCYSCS